MSEDLLLRVAVLSAPVPATLRFLHTDDGSDVDVCEMIDESLGVLEGLAADLRRICRNPVTDVRHCRWIRCR